MIVQVGLGCTEASSLRQEPSWLGFAGFPPGFPEGHLGASSDVHWTRSQFWTSLCKGQRNLNRNNSLQGTHLNTFKKLPFLF